MKYQPLNPVEYFSARVSKHINGCWHWTGGYFSSGYGYFSCVALGNPMNAHRAAWKLFRGEPGKLMVLHRCDDRGCVNPDHLFLGTGKDNMQDCSRKGRINRGEQRHNAILTEGIVREMRLLRQRGATYVELMGKFDLSKGTVGHVIRGESWRHVVA